MTTLPYHWVRNIEDTLAEVKKIPLWGYPPEFPLEACTREIKIALQIPDLQISLFQTQWRSPEQFHSGMGSHPFSLVIELSPLVGSLYWIMSQEDISYLTTNLLSSPPPSKSFSDPKFQEGFYRYLCLKALVVINELKPFKDLSLKIGEPSPLPQDGAICVDVHLDIPPKTIWARLIIPSLFHHSFKSYFALERPSILTGERGKDIDVDLKVQVASTQLTLSEYKKITPGDFVILDACLYDPQTLQGAVTLALENTPLFQAEISNSHVKIIDYTFYTKEEIPMPKDYSHDDDEEENDDDEIEDDEEDFDDDDDEEEDEDEEEEDEDFEDEDLEEEEEEEEEEEDFEEEAMEEDLEEESPLWSTKDEHSPTMAQSIPTQDIPVTLTVEIARLHMNLQKLLELKAGNVLDLPTPVDAPVHITVGGKTVALGELIKLGEVLGVRILRVGELVS